MHFELHLAFCMVILSHLSPDFPVLSLLHLILGLSCESVARASASYRRATAVLQCPPPQRACLPSPAVGSAGFPLRAGTDSCEHPPGVAGERAVRHRVPRTCTWHSVLAQRGGPPPPAPWEVTPREAGTEVNPTLLRSRPCLRRLLPRVVGQSQPAPWGEFLGWALEAQHHVPGPLLPLSGVSWADDSVPSQPALTGGGVPNRQCARQPSFLPKVLANPSLQVCPGHSCSPLGSQLH